MWGGAVDDIIILLHMICHPDALRRQKFLGLLRWPCRPWLTVFVPRIFVVALCFCVSTLFLA
jgi:hypothetical protein